MNARFQQRRDCFIQALAGIGWQVPKPLATMYVWTSLPDPWRQDSMGFCVGLVEATGVAVAPGIGFGPSGEGYVRFALVHEPEILQAAVTKIGQFLNQTRDLNP